MPSIVPFCFSGLLLISFFATAGDKTWSGGGGDNNWSTPANWGGTAPIAGDNLIFSGSARLTTNNDFPAGTSFNNIAFDNSAGAFVLSGSRIALTGSITNNANQAQTLSLDIAMATQCNVNTVSGNVILDGVLSGSGGPTKSGSYTLFLTNANTFTGLLQIGGGIVNVASVSDYGVPSAIGARAQGQEVLAGDGIGIHFGPGSATGTLQYTGSTPQSTNREFRMGIGGATIDASGSATTATLSFTHTGTNVNLFDTPGTRTLSLTGTNTGTNTIALTIADQSTNATSLIKSGGGSWTLSSNNSFTGATAVNAGVLVLRELYGSGSHSIASGAVLELFCGSGFHELATTTFSGLGTLRKTGGGAIRWPATSATFNLGVGSLIDIQGGVIVGGSSANEVWTNNHSDLNVEAGAFLQTVEANVRVNKVTGSGTIESGYNGAGYANFTFGIDNGSATFSGVIKDLHAPANLVKVGTGTQTLSGSNINTGNTTVSAGTLLINSSIGGSGVTVQSGGSLGGTGTVTSGITAASGGIIAPGLGGTSIGTLNTAAVSYSSGSALSVDLNGTTPTADRVASSGTVACGGALTIASITNASLGKVYTVVNANSVTGTFANLNHGAVTSQQGRYFQIAYTATTVTLTDVVRPASRVCIWDGGGSDNNWTTAANWNNDIAPLDGDDLQFAGSIRLAPVNDYSGDTNFGNIAFNSGASSFVISGNRVAVGGSIANNSTNPQTLNFNMILPATRTIDTASGDLTVGGSLSGPGGLTKSGAGKLTLSGANTYSGSTSILAGSVKLPAIVYAGAQTNAGGGWRTNSQSKPLDIDGNNIYGSDGYWLVGGSGSQVMPSYTNNWVKTSTTYTGNSGYYSVDDPLNPGSTVKPGTTNPGSNTDLFSFRLTGTIPKTIRVGIMIDALDNQGYNSTSVSIRLNDVTQDTRTVTSTIYNDRVPDWLFWDVFANVGDKISFQGVVAGGNTVTVTAFSFDSINSVAAILPSTTSVSLATNTTLDLNGRSQQIASLAEVPSASGHQVLLGAAQLTVGDTSSTVFSGLLSGIGGQLNKVGAGTLTLNSTNTFSGSTTVAAGTLLCNNTVGSATGTGAVTVNASATLGGTGTMTGPLSVNGGTVSPGNAGVGTLTVGPTSFNSTSTLVAEVGTASDLLAVQGALTLDGTVNVVGGAGVRAGIYTLISHSGALTDNLMNAGTVPTGYSPEIVLGGGTVQVNLAAGTATSLESLAPGTSVYGQPVTFMTTISSIAPAVGVPTGSVVFFVDGVAQGPVALTNGTASLTVSNFDVGVHSVQVNYAAVQSFIASTGMIAHTVAQTPTSVAITSSSPLSPDGNVTLTATVSPQAPGIGVPTGSITFVVDGAPYPSVQLNSGSASIPISLASGDATIQALYSGSSRFLPSSASFMQKVKLVFVSPPMLTPNPALTGQTISAVVNPGNASVIWDWGDGTVATGLSSSHAYTLPGIYSVTVTASANQQTLTEVLQLFVGMNANGDAGGGTPPDGITGILVGGNGAGESQGAAGKIICNYVRPSKTSYSGALGGLDLPDTLTQEELTGADGMLTLGTGVSYQTFPFALKKNGCGKATGLPKIEFDVRHKRFKFKAQRSELTNMTELFGAPRQFGIKKGDVVILRVPATLQIGKRVFLALTFQMNYQQINLKSGQGILDK